MEKEKMFVGQITQKAILKYKNYFVILKEEGSNHWILPGGRLNVGETTEAGLIREIKEELSVDATIGDIISLDVYHSGKISKNPKLFIFYHAEVLPNQEIAIKSEIVDIAYVSTKEDLKNYEMHENQRSVIEKFLD